MTTSIIHLPLRHRWAIQLQHRHLCYLCGIHRHRVYITILTNFNFPNFSWRVPTPTTWNSSEDFAENVDNPLGDKYTSLELKYIYLLNWVPLPWFLRAHRILLGQLPSRHAFPYCCNNSSSSSNSNTDFYLKVFVLFVWCSMRSSNSSNSSGSQGTASRNILQNHWRDQRGAKDWTSCARTLWLLTNIQFHYHNSIYNNWVAGYTCTHTHITRNNYEEKIHNKNNNVDNIKWKEFGTTRFTSLSRRQRTFTSGTTYGNSYIIFHDLERDNVTTSETKTHSQKFSGNSGSDIKIWTSERERERTSWQQAKLLRNPLQSHQWDWQQECSQLNCSERWHQTLHRPSGTSAKENATSTGNSARSTWARQKRAT